MKKGKTTKKLEFVGDDVGFIFQPRKPMTKHARKVMECSKETQKVSETAQPLNIIDISSPAKEELFIKQKKGKEKNSEKPEIAPFKIVFKN